MKLDYKRFRPDEAGLVTITPTDWPVLDDDGHSELTQLLADAGITNLQTVREIRLFPKPPRLFTVDLLVAPEHIAKHGRPGD